MSNLLSSCSVKRIKLPVEHAGSHIHGGPNCDCHQSVGRDFDPPIREATAADREMLGLIIAQVGAPPGMVAKVTASTELATTGTIVPQAISAPTLAEINPFQPDGSLIKEPKTAFERLYNLIQGTPCPHYGRQMRYPGGLSEEWKPCGTCNVCRMKEQAKELYAKEVELGRVDAPRA